MTDPKRKRRRWYQYRLRTLLVAMVLVSIPCSWLAVKLNHARRQREVVEAIIKSGGSVGDARPVPGLGWLQGLLSDDSLQSFASVEINGEITDATFEHLRALTSMRVLRLDHSNVTDAGLEQLSGLTNLGTLGLGDTQVTDAGLQHVGKLTQLGRLDLEGTKVTDAGLECLKDMRNLVVLRLENTQVTDAGVEHLKGLTKLRVLRLDRTQITDAGLAHLRGMTELMMLMLTGTRVTDAGLNHLIGLPKLNLVLVKNTQVTAEGKKKFQQANPQCDIDLAVDPCVSLTRPPPTPLESPPRALQPK